MITGYECKWVNREDTKMSNDNGNGDTILVNREPPKLGVYTLSRLMEDCLPEQIEDEHDMQRLIDKLWPALCCEFEIHNK